MIKTDDKELCCGCGVCSMVCPKQCISFNKDSLGHYYPVVDNQICIHCQRCNSVCPIQRTYEHSEIGREAWIAYSLDADIRMHGSSGGIFETIARRIVTSGGAVFACEFDEQLKLKCVEAKTIEEVRKQTKSKYLQNECSEMFATILDRVQTGKPVLFCSTPCQTAALKLYLGALSESENLYLLDFFCHGVPSQDFFDKCKCYVENHKGIKILGYEFRSKIPKGATPHYYTVTYIKKGKNKRKTELYLRDPFYLGFQKYITMRDSCYHCPYSLGNHYGDITIGDFHDIDKYIHGINRFDGVSTVLINTEKGKRIWENIRNTLRTEQIDIERLYDDRQIFAGGTLEPKQRNAFIKDLETLKFDEVVNKWLNSRREWKKAIYYSLPFFVRQIIKKTAGL